MPSRLPLADAHEKEHTYCTFCPKLCRHACPVSTAEARETTTPWGKMASLHHVAEGNLAHEPDVGATWFACTGCMRCRTFCDHDNEVARALEAGRAEARARGTRPARARAIEDAHREREALARERAAEIFGPAARRAAETVYAPGCTGCVVSPSDAEAGLVAVSALTRNARAGVLADACCGLPLLDAGDRSGFVSAARAFLSRAGSARRVVFSDPGCLHALSVLYPALTRGETDGGGASRGSDGPALLHLSELANLNLDSLRRVHLGESEVRYHDPCRLGRGLGLYDPPRAVLSRILGRAPAELHQNRDRAECSGAGGQIPRIFPETAAGIGRERRADVELAGGGVIVSPCPASRRAFDKAGASTIGFAELVAKSAGNLPA
jgi:Fe-S oxidoreductase